MSESDHVNFVKDLEEFHKKFNLAYTGGPRFLPQAIHDFRLRFLYEELDEYRENTALGSDEKSLSFPFTHDQTVHHLSEALDALVDLVYVALGTAYLHGFDFAEAWRRVHAANMAKVRATSTDQSKRGSLFDVVKPTGWQPPDHRDLVAHHRHREQVKRDEV